MRVKDIVVYKDGLKEQTTMDKPEPDIHFKLGDIFFPSMNIFKEVGINPGYHILDYGCGPGGYLIATSELVGRSGKIYGIDIYPAGNEPMLSPKYNRTCSVYRMPYPEDLTPLACYEYESCIYADYTTSPDAEVSFTSSLQERTRGVWVYGWSGNECMGPWVSVTLTGAHDGWCANYFAGFRDKGGRI